MVDGLPAVEPQPGVPWRAVGVYVLVAYGGMWLLCLPLWLNGSGLKVGWAAPLLVISMWTPALASFVVARTVTHERWPARVGLLLRRRNGSADKPYWLTVLRYAGLGIAVLIAFTVVVALLDALLGLRTDLSLDGYVARTMAVVPAGIQVPTWLIKAGLGINLIAGIVVVNPIAALGEELGWRGWLYPALLPLGRARAVALTGAIWGLWHAPIMLLGYNYPELPGPIAALLFIVPCILLTALLGWLRTASGSVLPAAFGHGAFNALGGVPIGVLPAAGLTVNAAVYGNFGAVGIAVATLALGLVVLLRRLGSGGQVRSTAGPVSRSGDGGRR